MKKLKSIPLYTLIQLFYEHYNTNIIVVDLIGIMSEKCKKSLQKYILQSFERDFSEEELQEINANL